MGLTNSIIQTITIGIDRKYIVFLSLFILNPLDSITFSQTYICPVIGYDFQKVDSDPVNVLDLRHKGYGFSSPLVGIKIKQRLFNQLYFNYYGNVTHKHVRGTIRNASIPTDLLLHCNYFKHQFLLTYLLNSKLYLGVGKSFNIVNKFHWEDFENCWAGGGPIENFNEQGWVFVIGFKFNKIDFETYYFNRDYLNAVDIDYTYGRMFNIYSIGLRVSYDFKLFNGFKKKEKLDCPEFK
ncbi:MAG TPA: hypothetical protein PLS73_11090 [Saprospiraceae bacterium]|nr:hypothetical protein [Saprospiraceae bacterium]